MGSPLLQESCPAQLSEYQPKNGVEILQSWKQWQWCLRGWGQIRWIGLDQTGWSLKCLRVSRVSVCMCVWSLVLSGHWDQPLHISLTHVTALMFISAVEAAPVGRRGEGGRRGGADLCWVGLLLGADWGALPTLRGPVTELLIEVSRGRRDREPLRRNDEDHWISELCLESSRRHQESLSLRITTSTEVERGPVHFFFNYAVLEFWVVCAFFRNV